MGNYKRPFAATMFAALAWLNVGAGFLLALAIVTGEARDEFSAFGTYDMLVAWGVFFLFYLFALPLFAASSVLFRLTDIANECSIVAAHAARAARRENEPLAPARAAPPVEAGDMSALDAQRRREPTL